MLKKAFTEILKRTLQTLTRHLFLPQPYLTSKGHLKLSHRSYNLQHSRCSQPITILRQLLTNVKDKDESSNRQGAVYKIKCCDCQATYIGEIDRNLNIRLTEHKGATGNGDINNHISEQHYQQTAESTETHGINLKI